MKPFQQRVIEEREELEKKISKLAVFMLGHLWSDLPEDECLRLGRQVEAMEDYSEILLERIEAFE